MGKRSKKESSILINHPVLKSLVDGKRIKPLLERTKDSWNGFIPDSQVNHLAQISALTGADIEDVIRMCNGFSVEELRSVSDGFSEVETLTFDSHLSDEQITLLLPVFSVMVSMEEQSLDSVKALLECRNTKPLKVKNNALCSYMMYMLSSEGYICQNWQYVATKQESFASQNGKILNEKDYSSSMSKMAKRLKYPVDDSGRYRLNEDIYNIVKGLKG